MRAYVARTFACRVRNGYGASEFMSIACDCPCGVLHVNSDWVVVEPVDHRYRPVAPGLPSHTTLITNLANLVQPLIRYDIGDRVAWLQVCCRCGNRWRAIQVEGRTDDILEFTNARGRRVPLLPLALVLHWRNMPRSTGSSCCRGTTPRSSCDSIRMLHERQH